MDISVIIVSWNAQEFLRQCLTTLLEFKMRRGLEVIVVDNASADGSAEMVEAEFSCIRVIRNQQNLGFARSNNIGIAASRGRYICLINSDVKLVVNCLDELADYLERHSEVGLVGPKILNSDGTIQYSCREFPSLWNNFCQASGLHRAFSSIHFFSGEQMTYFTHDRSREVDALSGCFWMVRREAFESVGLLDEDFFIYSEDVDWCRRCRDAGWQVVFLPTTSAIHYGGGSSENAPTRFAVEQQRATLQYWRKHHGTLECAGIRAILFFRHFVRYLLAVSSLWAGRNGLSEKRRRLQLTSACMKALVAGSS